MKKKTSDVINLDKKLLQQAKDCAFNLISYRDRSKYEIRKRLKNKGFNQDIINEVISVLTRLDYLDDSLFARKWIEERIKNKPRGRYMLRYELEKKGIKRSIIDKALSELINDEIELELTEKLAKKWLKKNSEKQNYQFKLKRYLHNKGISDYIIAKYFIDKNKT